MIDAYRAEIEELVERSEGEVRADVVHERLVAMGLPAPTARPAVRSPGPSTTMRRDGVGCIGPGSPNRVAGCSSTGAPVRRSLGGAPAPYPEHAPSPCVW
jgi:hypothetical protein